MDHSSHSAGGKCYCSITDLCCCCELCHSYHLDAEEERQKWLCRHTCMEGVHALMQGSQLGSRAEGCSSALTAAVFWNTAMSSCVVLHD